MSTNLAIAKNKAETQQQPQEHNSAAKAQQQRSSSGEAATQQPQQRSSPAASNSAAAARRFVRSTQNEIRHAASGVSDRQIVLAALYSFYPAREAHVPHRAPAIRPGGM